MDVVINVGGSPWKKTAQLAEKGSKDMRQAENVRPRMYMRYKKAGGTESSQEGQRIPTRGTETLAVTDVGALLQV